MKRILLLPLLLCALFSCKKAEETHLVTFYVGNCGDASIWSHVTVTIGSKEENFMTPESSNMEIFNCDENNSNACFFNLYPGTYNYNASDGGTEWNGSITVTDENCPIVELNY